MSAEREKLYLSMAVDCLVSMPRMIAEKRAKGDSIGVQQAEARLARSKEAVAKATPVELAEAKAFISHYADRTASAKKDAAPKTVGSTPRAQPPRPKPNAPRIQSVEDTRAAQIRDCAAIWRASGKAAAVAKGYSADVLAAVETIVQGEVTAGWDAVVIGINGRHGHTAGRR